MKKSLAEKLGALKERFTLQPGVEEQILEPNQQMPLVLNLFPSGSYCWIIQMRVQSANGDLSSLQNLGIRYN